MEGQNNESILKILMKNLSIDILKKNIIWIYEKYIHLYNKNYSKELFNHVDLDPNQTESKINLGFIIETGFKIFIILRKYIGVEYSEENEEGIFKILSNLLYDNFFKKKLNRRV